MIAALASLIALAVLRAEARARRWILLIVAVPAGVLALRWSAYREAWPELALSLALAALLGLAWWRLIGHRLPPAAESPIRVWAPEDEDEDHPDDLPRPG